MKTEAAIVENVAGSEGPGEHHTGSRIGDRPYKDRVGFVESRTNRGFGHGDTNVIVQRPPLAAPTVTRPTLSLPPIDGEVPQSLDPEPSAGVAPVVI